MNNDWATQRAWDLVRGTIEAGTFQAGKTVVMAEMLAAALREARADALDEAANFFDDRGSGDSWRSWEIADAIRALKAEPPKQ